MVVFQFQIAGVTTAAKVKKSDLSSAVEHLHLADVLADILLGETEGADATIAL